MKKCIPISDAEEEKVLAKSVENEKGMVLCAEGTPQRFSILSASIAVIDLTITTINHPGETFAIAGELKKAVKKKAGSNFMINRRKSLKAY